jgi:aspartyl-tRNA(Asn)/glutamyl-tRNA(Gln) amidotransferase subunit A
MSDLTKLTLADALDGLAAKRFSSRELTDAFLAEIDRANPHLNAYVVVAHEKARAMADASDARRAQGNAGRLEGAPLGIKDLFCTEGVRSTACSAVLGEFTPTYESTVTQNLWDAGAVMLGKLNMDEFAMGSSNETSCFGAVVNPWRASGGNAKLPRRRPPISASPQRPPTPAGRSASPQASPEPSASSRPTDAARAGASSHSHPRSTRPARSRRR